MSTEKPLILLVDDNVTIRIMLKKALSKIDAEFLEAENGKQAVELFEEHYPDAILMDVNMPEMDGFTACHEIRKLPSGKYAAIMMVTVKDDIDSINKAYEVGATDFETKPINMALIGQRVLYMIRNNNNLFELERSKSKLVNANNLALLGSWYWDIKRDVFTWSDELYGLVGRDPSDVVSHEEHILQYVHPEDREKVSQCLQQCKTNKERYTIDYRIIDDQDHVRYMHELTDILLDKAGNPTSIYGYVQDVSALKKAQIDLKKLNEELERRVIERTEQLQLANTELSNALEELRATQSQLIESEKMAALGKLVAGVAHEINTPIGIAIAAVSHINYCLEKYATHFNNEMITSEVPKSLLDTSNEALQLAEVNLKRAATLVNNFKQVAVDSIKEEKRSINLSEYLNEIFFSIKPKLKIANIESNISCPNELAISSYPGAIFQLITILTMNVIDHAYPEKSGGKIDVNCHQVNDLIKIEFIDYGNGIEEEYIKQIFEPFFTVGSKANSIGLGLHIAYNLVTQNLKGNIECESELNKGSKFTITLPRGH